MLLYNRSGQQTGETYALDTTLTKTEQVAEAKASGDKIADSHDELNNKITGVYDDVNPEVWKERTIYGLINQWELFSGSLDTATGAFVPGTSATVSDYIPVEPRVLYSLISDGSVCLYDSNKEFVAYHGYQTHQLLCPQNVNYVRIVTQNATKDTARIIRYDLAGQPNINGYVYTGVTDDSNTLIKKAIQSFAQDETSYFSKTNNQFDYEHDYVQFGNYDLARSGGGYTINASGAEYSSNKGVFPIKFFEVHEGQTITSNRRWMWGAYYDEEHEFLGNIGTQDNKHPQFVAPEGCYYARFAFYGMSIDELKTMVVYTIDNEVPSYRAPTIKNPYPVYQLDGNQISPNYLDKVIPSMHESQFLSAMKCLAIREANGREHAFRIGNFNMYVGNGSNGWDFTKKMLMDYGIDMCGFEEVGNDGGKSDLGAFLNSWQFPFAYYPTQSVNEPITIDFVSRFQILSSTVLSYECWGSSGSRTYLNCKVKMPRLLDVLNPYRVLSIYVVHLPLVPSGDKLNVANQILAQVAEDTSDYIIIFGDMNDSGATEEEKTYWRTFEAAGLRPILPITSKTITEDEMEQPLDDPNVNWRKMALDQFCISSNIDIARFGIVNTKDEYYGDEAMQMINGDKCLSDHDFVWTDLIFKDEARTTSNSQS